MLASRMFAGFTVWMSVEDMANFYRDQETDDQVGVLELVITTIVLGGYIFKEIDGIKLMFRILQAHQA